MAATKGSKPLITKGVYDIALKYLQNTDKANIPHFVRKLEKKESYLAECLGRLAKTISTTHANRLKEETGVTMSKEHFASLALDLYVMSWFSYLILDIARDIEFEKNMQETMGL